MLQRCRYIPGAEASESSGLVTAFTNVVPASSYCFFSRAIDSVADVKSRLDLVVETSARARASWSLGIVGDWVSANPRFAKTLAARGFERRAIVYGMWSDELAARTHDTPRIEFRCVSNDDDLALFAAINNVAHGANANAGPAIYAHYLRAPHSNAWVGFAEDEPVSCAAAFPTAHGVYLGGVATVAHQRGRGYGEAASRHALEHAMRDTGLRRGVLFASRDRTSFYERMGFALGCSLWLYRQAAR